MRKPIQNNLESMKNDESNIVTDEDKIMDNCNPYFQTLLKGNGAVMKEIVQQKKETTLEEYGGEVTEPEEVTIK